MKNAILLYVLALCVCANAKPESKLPSTAALATGPLVEVTFDAKGRELMRVEWSLIDGGRRARALHIYRDGRRIPFVFQLPSVAK